MKTYKKDDIVGFKPIFLYTLEVIDNLEEGYTDSWKDYMKAFKNYYIADNYMDKLKAYPEMDLIITGIVLINIGGIEYKYYNVKDLANGEELPMYFIPEFFKEYYNMSLTDSARDLNFKDTIRVKIAAYKAMLGFDLNFGGGGFKPYVEYNNGFEDTKLTDVQLKKIKIPEFKLIPYKFRVISDGKLETKKGFKFYENWALVFENDKFTKVKVNGWYSKLNKLEIIETFGKVKILDYIKSSEIFGYKPSKKEMFESNNLFNIDKLLFDYESKKTKTNLDVVEVNNGTKSLKFLMEDVEFIFNEPKGYNVPTKIKLYNVKKTDILNKSVRFTNDKGLPVKKHDKGELIEMWNTHIPMKGSRFERREVAWDKNTKVKIKLSDKSVISCKFKNIKIVK